MLKKFIVRLSPNHFLLCAFCTLKYFVNNIKLTKGKSSEELDTTTRAACN